MPRTGNAFIDVSSYIILLIPLMPVVFIFIHKKYSAEALNFLMILCLLKFMENILSVPANLNGHQPLVHNIFGLAEFIILLWIARSALPANLRPWVNMIIVGLLTAIITFYSIKGMGYRRMGADILQEMVIVGMVTVVLYDRMEGSSLAIFSDPLFWISVGTLFYFMIAVIVNIITGVYTDPDHAPDPDRVIMLNIASVMRYIFYALAVLFYNRDREQDPDSPDHP
jgi:hypothetical protein